MLTGLLLILPLFAPRTALAAPQETPPASGDVRVHFRVDWTTPTRYDATVMITNMTTEPIAAWTLEFDLFPVADRMDLVAWSVEGTRHVVHGAGTMRSIAPGAVVWFTYSAEWTGDSVTPPSVCVFNGVGCTFEVIAPPPVNPHEELPVEIAWWVSWQGLTQFRTQVVIHNLSDDPIDFWNLQFTSEATIAQIAHVSHSKNGTRYDIAGKGWTRRIEPDAYVWFTMDGVYVGDEILPPRDCVFNGFECEFIGPEELEKEKEEPQQPNAGYCTLADNEIDPALAEDIGIAFRFTSLWATGYTATIELTNNSGNRPMRDWKLEFDLPSGMTVTRFWNGDLTKSGTHYTVTALLYNSCIEPGVGVTFGFEGAHNGAPVKPTVCQYDGTTCAFARFTSTAIESDEAFARSGFALDAPFPNPFFSAAVVPFRVERTQRVDLTVWDLQGRRVASLFSGVVAAGASVEARLEGGGLSPGAYLLRLSGESGEVSSRPLMLVR